ncbi:hypothetical protein Kpho02_25270 [Kitasatospora phosalacinea]|uniref:Uncharacterized protein n=1 Tax=Kitasatospora phosalacinea TaxID=2065 RepID=A0A9W6Q833_9ACTN|nr:hypothetical protein [Kitasatospora phosalacinea]GLW70228.1 hypothetical protein Kpho02_25270 [Kitasatospora phosalacinea]
MSTRHPPAPPGPGAGALPRRGAVGLWLQFCLQWFWLPFRVVWYLFDDPAADCVAEEQEYRKFVLTPSRYRLERSGTRAEWEAWADRALARGTAAATRGVVSSAEHYNTGRTRYRVEGDALVPRTTIRRRYYRGIGAEGLAVLAARRGWQIDRNDAQKSEIHLFRSQPVPPHPQQSGGPHQQPSAGGGGWR